MSDKDGDTKEPVKDPSEKQKQIQKMLDGAILNDRSCTDCPCILVFIVFLIGWIIILSVASANGVPDRIIRPSNFRGDLCGDSLDQDFLVDFPNLFIPKPSRLGYGLCVNRCPGVNDYVCNNDVEPRVENASIMAPNSEYSHTSEEYLLGKRAYFDCVTNPLGDCDNETEARSERYQGLELKLRQYKCFINFYGSGATLHRCLPFQDERDNATLATLVGESLGALQDLADFLGVSAYFNRGFAEVEQAWLVILITSITCLFISLLWIFMLRCLIKPIVYLSILLILALLIFIGYLAKLMADDLEDVKVPGDTATDDQIKTWRAIQYIFWILAAMYVIVMIWMIKRIKIAIAIMREASYTFLSSPGLIVIPPVVFILVIGWVAFFIVTTVFIQTIGKLEPGDFRRGAADVFGEQIVNFTIDVANSTSDSNESTINVSSWEQDENVKYLHAYNFFGFLWMSTLCIMYGFYVTAMVGSSYYYSASQMNMRLAEEGKGEDEGGKEKTTAYFAIPRSAWNVFRYHLGTLLFGSFLIALIQFVRALFLYFKETFLVEWQESCTVGCLIKIIECCLWYIQKVVEIISKNAFIINCVMNTNFCSSAAEAVSIIGANAARVSVLATLSAVCFFVLKVFIVMTNLAIAWALINTTELTQDRPVESGLFPMVGIAIISYIIASVFMSVYESLVDTTLMAFLLDEKEFNGEFMPEELAELTDQFKDAEMARREYEQRLKVATGSKDKVKAVKTAA